MTKDNKHSLGKHGVALALGKQGFALAMGLATTVLSYLVALHIGPVEVRVALANSSFVAPPWYLATVGLPFGILLAEALIDFREYKLMSQRMLPFIMLLVLGGLGSLRFLIVAPTSGHSLITAYYLLHHLYEQREGRSWKLGVGLLVIVQSAYFKLVLWDDPSSFLIGAGLGIFAWGIERTVFLFFLFKEKRNKPPASPPY